VHGTEYHRLTLGLQSGYRTSRACRRKTKLRIGKDATPAVKKKQPVFVVEGLVLPQGRRGG
jgi:hypothetical protein